jgi:hypothetical protein
MAAVRYNAMRSLVPGISENDSILMTLLIRHAGLTRSRKAYVQHRRSLSRLAESYYYAGEYSWSIDTRPLDADDSAEMRQFLDSVEDGQVFEFAPDTAEDDWRYVNFEAGEYTESPVQGRDDYKTFSFTLTEVG